MHKLCFDVYKEDDKVGRIELVRWKYYNKE